MKTLIFFIMVFLHIVDDFYLQGILMKMKQKRGNRDYIVALLIHGYSWSFMVHLPFIGIMLLCNAFGYVTMVIINMIIHAAIHAVIDHLKENMRTLDFVDEQIGHLAQVIVIWTVMVLILFE